MRDVLYIIGLIFFLGMSTIFGYVFLDEVSEQPILQQTQLVNETFDTAQTSLDTSMDSGFIILFISLYAGALMLSHLVPSRPLFFVPFIIVLLFLAVFTAQVSNIWHEFTIHPSISPVMSNFVYIPHILNNLPIYTVGMGVLLAIVLFMSIPREQRF